jgi:hypothetical protein
MCIPKLMTLVQIHGSDGSVYAKNSNIELYKLADDPERMEEVKILAEYGKKEKASGGTDPAAISTTGHFGQVQDMISAIQIIVLQ